MDDFTETIFRNAVFREDLAYRMYRDLAIKTEGEARRLLLEIAEEELIHKTLFSKMDPHILEKVNSLELKPLNLLKDISMPDSKDILKILDFAISEEQRAYDDYNLIIKHMEPGKSRDAIRQIAIQELRHRTLIEGIKDGIDRKDKSA